MPEMNKAREDSPDWLRSFQAPTSTLTLSSDSDSPNGSPHGGDKTDDEDTVVHINRNRAKVGQTHLKKEKIDDFKESEGKRKKDNDAGSDEDGKVFTKELSKKHLGSNAANRSIWTLSSDSESSPKKKENMSLSQESGDVSDLIPTGRGKKSPEKQTSKGKSPKKGVKARGQTPEKEKNVEVDAKITENDGNGNVETAEDEASEKHIKPNVSTSRLPLVLSEKVHRSKALVECDGDSIDLSGDMGAVGRVVVSGSASENHEMLLDLKGTIYKTTIVPSRTFCIVSFGQTEAKVEAIMNDFIQLKPQSNVYEAETMVEGTLEGFSFNSEDEAEKMPKANPDQNEEIDGKANEKAKGRADKTSAASRKRGKSGGKSQPAKKARKKTANSKKPKAKK